jgi:hypothetical protein
LNKRERRNNIKEKVNVNARQVNGGFLGEKNLHIMTPTGKTMPENRTMSEGPIMPFSPNAIESVRH